MKVTALHVFDCLEGYKTQALWKRLVAANNPNRLQQIVVSLASDHNHTKAIHPAFEVHDLGLRRWWHYPAAFIRLVRLMRKTQSDLVMTWGHRANILGMSAVVASRTGPRRVVWNLPRRKLHQSGRGPSAHWAVLLLGRLSWMPWGVTFSSLSTRKAYETLGYRPRHWVYLPKNLDLTRWGPPLPAFRKAVKLERDIKARTSDHEGLHKLTQQARKRRSELGKTTFIGVTGSSGKTTTVDLIGAILNRSSRCHVGRSGANNRRASLATLLTVEDSAEFCVQEISGDAPRKVARHVRILKPQIGVVTVVGTDHYKNFRTREAIAEEKGTLIERLPPSGTAILNADDPLVHEMRTRTSARVVTYGQSADASIRAVDVSSVWPDRLSFTIVGDGVTLPLQTQFVGEQWTTSVLAAIACALSCGADLKSCAEEIGSFAPVFGRLSVHDRSNGSAFVLDTQKAPLWSLEHSFKFLREARAPFKTMVVGTISDYSGKGGETHRKVARRALEVAERVIFVGPRAGHVDKLRQDSALKERLHTFATAYQASAFIKELLVPGELVYIKSSISDHLERIMLSELSRVVCWREACGRKRDCTICSQYRIAHRPPFGLDSNARSREF